ncbi:hypothetical protein Fmac_009022 [Flemingia macrophylla]|uniref:TIR domain-containing protein n=1 Tax=Flemingia macrophylla TaxID=520843 RepID=A0ABD1MZ25_9FABA
MLYFFGSCLFHFALFFFASRLFRKLEGGEMPELESDNNTPPQVKYDVFVSFRGEDVRDNFLSHLTEAFDRNKINTFVDDKLKTGEEIWSSLVAAIHASSISLIIFSPDYASSRWCLKELVTILECSKKYGRLVIPVFYNVQPTHVRHQSGSYKNAFTQHMKKHRTEVQLWRDALTKCADFSGIGYSKFRNDAVMVKYIVKYVMERLVKPPLNSIGLVGIEEKRAAVESLIRKEPKITRLVGIWGMGGIGKTTLAEEIFNKLQSEYEASYFLANERKESEKQGIISLKEKVFSRLLKCDVEIGTPNSLPADIVRKICQTKVLVVLDDVDDFDHIEKILGTLDNFGPGSRILITTRDKQVLNKANEIYPLEKLSSHEALHLFISKAFNQVEHQRVANKLIESVVNYAQGIPLAVKVLASLLCGKDNKEWKSLLDKLNTMPCKEIYDILKLSFDSLEFKEQEIFLDLACFFLRRHEPVDVGKLKSLLKVDESDCSMAFELGRLKDKALITISGDNIVSMHDTLQEMAWKIARDQSIKEDSRRRIRLWDSGDVWKALRNGKVEAIRSIQIDLEKIKTTKLLAHQFAKMSELKFLHVESGNSQHGRWFRSLKSKLRYLYWPGYPLKSLPTNFLAEELVILKLEGSRTEELDGVKNLVSLKEVDLSSSRCSLEALPELPPSLKALDVKRCSLEALPELPPSLITLDVRGCSSLKALPELPSSFEIVDVRGCSSLETLSGLPPCLEILHARGCSSLKALPKLPPSLETLEVKWCSSLMALPELPPSLKTLDVNRCSSLKALPELPPSLETLDVSECVSLESLPELPTSLETLKATYCRSLKVVLFPSTMADQLRENKKCVWFNGCLNLDEHCLKAIELNAQINVMKFAQNDDDVIYVNPGSSVPNWFKYKTTNDYIIIDNLSSPVLGFIFCFVFHDLSYRCCEYGIQMAISDGEGEGTATINDIWWLQGKSDQVYLRYDKKISDFLTSRAEDLARFQIRVILLEYTGIIETVVNQDLVKGFGLHPISTLTA